mmetsp:Transcript_38572/g.36920  ORF Transcript_38572/g.36920 Transcript_38572/m.36920 type:complete len:198 (-) Transcript_38572:194-787(-)
MVSLSKCCFCLSIEKGTKVIVGLSILMLVLTLVIAITLFTKENAARGMRLVEEEMLAVIVVVRVPRIIFGLLTVNKSDNVNYKRNFFYVRMGTFIMFVLIKTISLIISLSTDRGDGDEDGKGRGDHDGDGRNGRDGRDGDGRDGEGDGDGRNGEDDTFHRGMKVLAVVLLVVMFLVDFYFTLVVREYWRKSLPQQHR